jgi:anaerobic dimethyl sulfoxide reductase subunit C (anchor subunit)
MHNTSLIIFTLLIQNAAGVIGVSILIKWLKINNQISIVCISFCVGAIGIGLISAFAHIGSPKNASYALVNIKKSWFSREIFAVSLFAFSTSLLWVMIFTEFQKGVFIAEAVVLSSGLLSIWSMSQVYRLRTIPLWNNYSTPIDFFGTALLTGPVISAILMLLVSGSLQTFSVFYLIVSFMGLCCKITAIKIKKQQQSKQIFWYKYSKDIIQKHTPFFVVYTGLYSLGMALLGLAATGIVENSLFLLSSAFGIILLTEIWNRFCFYNSDHRIGL